jgi:hypothetical protein
MAGGGSIGIASLNSIVSIADCRIETANAGDGGSGAIGQTGMTLGGNGGLPDALGGCQGGKGGPGGGGGASGGGAGGISAGIVHKGDAPTTDTIDYAIGQAGTKGDGGIPGTNDGVDGVAENVVEVQ